MFRKLLVSSCLISSVSFAYATDIHVAAGLSRDYLRDNYKPFVLNQVSESNWSYNSQVTLPFGMSTLRLMDMSCTDNTCLLVGIGLNTTTKRPFIKRSDSRGITWTNADSINNIPKNFEPLYMKNAGCEGQNCFITGNYWGNNNIQALLFKSGNEGKSWSFVNLNDYFPADSSARMISKVNCSANNCAALGGYRDKVANYHFIAFTSLDGGDHWQPIQGLGSLDINYLNYQQDQLFAFGYSAKNEKMPTLFKSNDHGNTWEKAEFKGADNSLNYTFNQLKCEDKTCIIGGFATFDNNKKSVVAFTSNDRGINWQVTLTQSFDELNWFQLNFLEKSANTWLMGGSAFNQLMSNSQPLLMLSTDKGNSWKSVELSSIPHSDLIALSDLNCVDNHCVSVGSYKASPTSKDKFMPFIIESKNGGLNWNLSNLNGIKQIYTSRLTNVVG